jgi:hypothetical protein
MIRDQRLRIYRFDVLPVRLRDKSLLRLVSGLFEQPRDKSLQLEFDRDYGLFGGLMSKEKAQILDQAGIRRS